MNMGFRHAGIRILLSESHRFAVACVLLMTASVAAAEVQTPFDSALPARSNCVVDVAVLRPTQFAVGMKEVEMRAEKIRTQSSRKREDYLQAHIAPIVIGPGGIPYLLDHHHLARALQLSGTRPALYAEVKENWSHLSEKEFWAKMNDSHWLYLYDETGRGPLDATALPHSIDALRDDPYRSLAWMVRTGGGYRETPDLFADFAWANFFRGRIPLDKQTNGLEEAVKTALPLAHSREARSLPGYVASGDGAAR